jgi:AraC family transcriptional regulator
VVFDFSPFHFHRIFSAMVGETLSSFIRRLRLERAASMLIDHPKQTITEIAMACGFSSSASFARAFAERFGMSASELRQGGSAILRGTLGEQSKIRKTDNKQGKAIHSSSRYLG